MPELPDIEVFKRRLDATSLHQKIASVEVRSEKVLGVSARELRSATKGRAFETTRRHGKRLFAGMDDGGWLMLHFGMTGRLACFENPDDEPRHSRVLFVFENGSHLSFDDSRMFGGLDIVESPDAFVEAESLGPDALDANLSVFRERLEGRKGAIKSALINQRILAGIGNIYSDEILFQSHVHPNTSIEKLDEESIKNPPPKHEKGASESHRTRSIPDRTPGLVPPPAPA